MSEQSNGKIAGPARPDDKPKAENDWIDSYVDAQASGPQLPPGKRKTVEETLAEMSRVPLFMNSMDDMQDDNPLLDALKAIAYEGTRAEIAENFKNQGNDCVKTKQWSDAREFYTKAIQALEGPVQPQDPEAGEPDVKIVEIDEEAEARRETALAEACHANRALCNLEMKNYGSCQRDCAATLQINARNTKAWYRAASACLALDKIPEATDACQGGLEVEPSNAALKALLEKVNRRRDHLAELERSRQQRQAEKSNIKATLAHALKARGILVKNLHSQNVDMEDAAIALEKPQDASSTLSFPVLFLYAMDAESDFVKAVREDESIGQHLSYVLPPPFDAGKNEYASPEAVECYMETIQGGLIKAGKNLSLLKLLSSGKIEVVDGLVRVNVVPKTKSAAFVEEFKRRNRKE